TGVVWNGKDCVIDSTLLYERGKQLIATEVFVNVAEVFESTGVSEERRLRVTNLYEVWGLVTGGQRGLEFGQQAVPILLFNLQDGIFVLFFEVFLQPVTQFIAGVITCDPHGHN